MSKKMMLLALAVVSAVMFVLPAAASANWGIIPGSAKFAGSGTANISAAGEPTITCEGPSAYTLSFSGNGTTGSFGFHGAKCHIVVFFVTLPCSNTGTPADGTLSMGGTFHTATITKGKRGFKTTITSIRMECQNTSPITLSGNLIGEVMQPTSACPVKTKQLGFSFSLTSGSQTHKTTDGDSTEYDLSAQTEGGSTVTAGFSGSGSMTGSEEVTVECNNP